jgi:hypothetical protein
MTNCKVQRATGGGRHRVEDRDKILSGYVVREAVHRDATAALCLE